MECDICFEKFDHSINKPLVLFRCAHTMCSKCVSLLSEPKCPSCGCVIEETRPNWSLLKTVPESDYDKLKSDLTKSISEIELLEKGFTETEQRKKEENSNLIKSLRSQVENRANDLIKQINMNKKNLFKEIDTNCKSLNNREPQLYFVQTDEKREETKEKINSNKFGKEQLLDLNVEFISRRSELKSQMNSKSVESYEFSINENTKIGENFIGEIRLARKTVL